MGSEMCIRDSVHSCVEVDRSTRSAIFTKGRYRPSDNRNSIRYPGGKERVILRVSLDMRERHQSKQDKAHSKPTGDHPIQPLYKYFAGTIVQAGFLACARVKPTMRSDKYPHPQKRLGAQRMQANNSMNEAGVGNVQSPQQTRLADREYKGQEKTIIHTSTPMTLTVACSTLAANTAH